MQGSVTTNDDSASRILFGSCHSLPLATETVHRSVWDSLSSRNASAFVWGGDAIYGDESFEQATPARLYSHYERLLNLDGYKRFLDKNHKKNNDFAVMGVLDDHDFGIDNGDKRYQYRRESGQAFMDFLGKSNSNVDWSIMEQRAQQGKGIYGVKVLEFDEQSTARFRLLSDEEASVEPTTVSLKQRNLSQKSVAVFMLDVRTNKTPWPKGFPERYAVDYEGDFLGEEQWKWFESALQRSTAGVNIVVQGLQVHADRYFGGCSVESWSSFPMSQHRLYQALMNAPGSTPLLVTGDVHMSQILRRDCRRQGGDDKRSLIEVTTSGMTHAWCGPKFWGRESSWTPLFRKWDWFRKSMCTGMHSAQLFMNDLVVLDQSNEGATRGRQYTLEMNFAEFEFEWESRQTIVRILGETVGAPPLLSTRWDFEPPLLQHSFVKPADFQQRYNILQKHGAQPNDWICINYTRNPTTLYKLVGFFSPILLMLTMLSSPVWLPALVTVCIMRKRHPRNRF